MGLTMRYLSHRYRPELHYMRGPGPKWLEKHARRSGEIPIEKGGHREATAPLRRLELMLRRLLPARWSAAQGGAGETSWSLAGRLRPWSV